MVEGIRGLSVEHQSPLPSDHFWEAGLCVMITLFVHFSDVQISTGLEYIILELE